MVESKKNAVYTCEIEDLADKYGTNLAEGLEDHQVQNNRERYGINELKKVKRSFFKVIIAPIINLLIIIYLISAIVILILGLINEDPELNAIGRTIPTFAILAFNAIVAIFQQYRAEKQLKALKKLSAAQSIVLRNGEEVELNSEDIVVGDIIKLELGDKVPADCRIIEGVNLNIDESSLTGESEPVKKWNQPDVIEYRPNQTVPIQDQKNMLFLGTYISSGRGKAMVVKVGQKTELGKINVMLEESNTGDIPLRRKMNTLAKKLGTGVIVLLIISVIYEMIILSSAGLLDRNNVTASLIVSVDLGMKVMPINLPLLTTIVLLTGVLAMAKKGVIVREISSTESLGRVSVVCSDKTGTLTKNEMTAVIVWTPDNEFGVSGFGYDPDGIIYELKSGKKCEPVEIERLVISGYLNNNAKLTKEVVKTMLSKGKGSVFKDKWEISGLPTEGALTVLGKKYDAKIEQKLEEYEFVFEYNFDSSIKRMTKVFRRNGEHYAFTKGATEWLLPLCSQYLEDDQLHDLDPNYAEKITQAMRLYAEAGYRVLAVCDRELKGENILNSWEGDDKRAKIEQDLIFLGLAVILDPPREDVERAVIACQNAGIKTVMITGDSISTGKAIAKQLNIYEEGENIAAEADQLYDLSDDDFLNTTVYGRVSPEHKQVIVRRFQQMNKVVSMSGDGVNDALALSMADCGLAMGIKGTEVAKEAADMVITDDSFSTIVTGVREGRGLYKKIQAIVYFFVCVSVMEAIILFINSFNPNPTWEMFEYGQLNLLYVTAHMFPPLGFTFMWTAKTVMNEKPRDSGEIIPNKYYLLMLFNMLFMGLAILAVYYLSYYGVIGVSDFNRLGVSSYESSTFTGVIISESHAKSRTMALVLIFLLEGCIMPLQIRRINQPVTKSWRDAWEIGMYLTTPIITLVCMYIMPLQEAINGLGWIAVNFVWLDAIDWLIIAAFCMPQLIGFELLRHKMGIIKHKDVAPVIEEDDDDEELFQLGTAPRIQPE